VGAASNESARNNRLERYQCIYNRKANGDSTDRVLHFCGTADNRRQAGQRIIRNLDIYPLEDDAVMADFLLASELLRLPRTEAIVFIDILLVGTFSLAHVV